MTSMTEDLQMREPDSYAEAEDELAAILASLESDDVDVDQLSAQVARARWLIEWCRARLATAEVSISELLADPEATEPAGDDAGSDD